MNVIRVKYLAPTDFKGARMKASLGTNSITVPFQYEISNDHARAHDVAIELLNRLGHYEGLEISGSGRLNNDYIFTLGVKS